MATTRLPTHTSYVDQNWFLEPLKGPEHPSNYLDRFPPEVYNTGPESHLSRFLYVLLGPSGVGYLRQNALEARLKLEELGLELYDLDAFYGNPLRFTRITDELYDEDPHGLVDRNAWDMIRAKDAQYRNRVMDFLDGVRAGNTPLGMRYVARSGLGHELTIIENYKAIFDEYSDDPLGLTHYGKTRFLEEMIVLPRREIPLSEVQTITVSGSPTGGTFDIDFNGEIADNIAWNAPAQNVQTFLEGLQSINPGDVEVTGGPGPNKPWRIRFMGTWSAQNVPQIRTNSYLTGGSTPQIQSDTAQSGVDTVDEIAYISPGNQRHLQEAIDRLRPQNVIPTVGEAPGLRARQLWQSGRASSEYDEVVRYVRGSPDVSWPPRTNLNWIQGGVERRSLKPINARTYGYENYHNVVTTTAFTEEALTDPDYGTATTQAMEQYRSEHVGPFTPVQRQIFPFYNSFNTLNRFSADMVLADYTQPLTTSEILTDSGGDLLGQLINGIYPTDYANLPGIPPIQYDYEQFWASRQRSEGTEYLEIDLGSVKAINTIQFETTYKPVNIDIDFEVLDLDDQRRYVPVQLDTSRSSNAGITFSPENGNSWSFVQYYFSNAIGGLILSRYLRLKFSRRNNIYSPFTITGMPGSYHPWSIDVRNLRVGRAVTNI